MEDLLGLIVIAIIWVVRTIMSAKQKKDEAPPPQNRRTQEESEEPSMGDIWEEIFGEELPGQETQQKEPETPAGERPKMEEVVRDPFGRQEKAEPAKPKYEVPKGLEPSYKEGMSFEDFVAEARRDRRKQPATTKATAYEQRRKRKKRKAIKKAFDLRQAVINDAILNRPYK